MKRRVMRQEDVAEFCRYLQGEERSQGTIETYRREIRAFAATLPENRVVTKEVVVAWKETLAKRYAVSTVNGKLAALNGLFSFLGWRECRVKPLRRQRELFRDKGQGTGQGGVPPPARCGQEEGELAAVLSHGDSGLYGDAGVGAAFRHSAGAGRRPGAGGL